MYTVFNEGWGQYDTQRIVKDAKRADPSRLWVAASGWWDPQYGNSHNHSHLSYNGYVSISTSPHIFRNPHVHDVNHIMLDASVSLHLLQYALVIAACT
jgi:hypothetical protein